MKDKVVIVTGGSSGIGRALAEVFGKNGSLVVITGRNRDELVRAAEALRAGGISVHTVQADVALEADNRRMVAETLERFGRVDVLINNAGISMRAIFEDVDPEVLRRVMEINFFGVIYATKHCLPEIIKHRGSIVGISSIAGFRGLPGRTGYSASKFALNGFLESLRTELRGSGVHVLTACPGFTASNIRKRSLTLDGTAQGDSPREEDKMMTAEACAAHIYNATVRRKRTLVLTAQGKFIVLLNKIFPSLADRIVYNAMRKEANSPIR